MAIRAGNITRASDVQVRVATDTVTSDYGSITTTETTVQSVAADLISGETYKIVWHCHVSSDSGSDEITATIREDNSSGTQLNTTRTGLYSITTGAYIYFEAEYTASSTASKTFVGTIYRATGSGTVHLEAASSRPAILYVDKIAYV